MNDTGRRQRGLPAPVSERLRDRRTARCRRSTAAEWNHSITASQRSPCEQEPKRPNPAGSYAIISSPDGSLILHGNGNQLRLTKPDAPAVVEISDESHGMTTGEEALLLNCTSSRFE